MKIIHFAFFGIKTPWIYGNQCGINHAAGKILQKFGFSYYSKYDQYRYIREDYIRNNSIDISKDENISVFSLPIKKSPYSYEKPIRKIL